MKSYTWQARIMTVISVVGQGKTCMLVMPPVPRTMVRMSRYIDIGSELAPSILESVPCLAEHRTASRTMVVKQPEGGEGELVMTVPSTKIAHDQPNTRHHPLYKYYSRFHHTGQKVN
jgi:hypothetical protein